MREIPSSIKISDILSGMEAAPEADKKVRHLGAAIKGRFRPDAPVTRVFSEAEVKAAGDRTVTAVITSAFRDRQGDVILPSGGDLSFYLKNPVVLWCHDYWNRVPIGRAQWLKVEGASIVAKIEFSKSEFASEVYQAYKDGFLRTFSIGFVAGDIDREARLIKTWTLLEISCVPVPANPEAAVIGSEETQAYIKKTFMDKGLLSDLGFAEADEIEPEVKAKPEDEGEKEPPPPPPPPPPPAPKPVEQAPPEELQEALSAALEKMTTILVKVAEGSALMYAQLQAMTEAVKSLDEAFRNYMLEGAEEGEEEAAAEEIELSAGAPEIKIGQGEIEAILHAEKRVDDPAPVEALLDPADKVAVPDERVFSAAIATAMTKVIKAESIDAAIQDAVKAALLKIKGKMA
jgi:HK97 family phage prohead protease